MMALLGLNSEVLGNLVPLLCDLKDFTLLAASNQQTFCNQLFQSRLPDCNTTPA
jgi:hypothetical protein